MFPPTSDKWRRISNKTGQLVSPSRISVPARLPDDNPSSASTTEAVLRMPQTNEHSRVRSALSIFEHAGKYSSSLESLTQPPGCSRDKADKFVSSLKSIQQFQFAKGLRDNREKLADYLKQCECSMPKHGNDQLTEIDADLQAAWNQPQVPKNSSASKALKQQAAIWELCQTELNILRHLKTIIEIYISVTHYLQSNASLLLDISTDKLFPNISEVFGSHCTLWKRHLKPALLRARANGCPIRPRDFVDGFTDFHRIFEPSMNFCLRIPECKDYLRLMEKSETFNDFVKWAQKLSSKNYNVEDGSMDLQLKSLLMTPFQRLTKYGLLLQEILKHTEDPEDREALDLMIRHVTDFCNCVNSRYQERADEEEVRGVSVRLEDVKLSDQIDSLGEECSAHLEQFKLSLSRPMPHNGLARRKLGEGDFKMKDDRGKWSDVKLLLFTDLLLVAKVGGKRQNLRLLRAPVRLDKLALYRLSDSTSFVVAVITDFDSLDSLLCLSAPDQKVCDDWLERLSQSQAALREQLVRASRAAGRCENCGFEPPAASTEGGIALRPKPVRWFSETTSKSSSASAAAGSTRQRARTTLQEVSMSAQQQRQQLHVTHSSCKIESLNVESQQQVIQAKQQQQQQQPHVVVQRHLYQYQQLQLNHQHQRDKSVPAVPGRSRMMQEQQRCNSADEADLTASTSAAVADSVKEFTPERRRLINFLAANNQAPHV